MTRPIYVSFSVLSALVLLLHGCGPVRDPPAGLPLLREAGQLQVFTTDQRTDGRNMMLRGAVRNPYDEPVEGVRVICRILSATLDAGSELDRHQKVLDVTLAPGQQTVLRFDIQSMYASGRFGFFLEAYAIKLGDTEMPLPQGWRPPHG